MGGNSINISLGMRLGGGECLDDEVPFSPDALCCQCCDIFKKDRMYTPPDENVLHIEYRNPIKCRLCAILISNFQISETLSPLEIEYLLVPRYGYLVAVDDIIFRPVGPRAQNTKVVRFGLQKAKLGKYDRDYPKMVHFEPEISSSTDSEESMAQAAKWFKECSENHVGCKAAFPKTSFVPTRLVEIWGSDENSLSVCLREKESLSPEVRYAALSHCWGLTMPFKLKLEAVDCCKESIPLNKLSKVFRDAIKFSWRSNIQYIWIDSLCIIQDSIEDWNAESSQMGAIYHHSILNIAATGFPDGENGLFVRRDSNLITPIAIFIEAEEFAQFNRMDKKYRRTERGRGNYYLVDTGTWRDDVDESPLCRRGWVIQERALSVRTLHFGRQQLFWECCCTNASEVYPKGLLRGTMIRDPKVLLSSSTKDKESRMESLQTLRDVLLILKKGEDDFRAKMRNLKDENPSLYDNFFSESYESDDEISDRNFAKRMKALRTNRQLPADESSESSDSDPDFEFSKLSKKKVCSGTSLEDLNLSPQDFVGCDLSILDELNIKGWKKFKTRLESWGFGPQSGRVRSIPVRGMTLEQVQWLTMVETFSRCSLSFSKDKLVAISGMAKSLSQEMNCEYLAGLWRRDLEHQLLWKVNGAFRAPKKDGTRGPSWSWASVDGGIVIPDWRGYFSDIPGDITWLARVDNVSVQLAEAGPFGQVRSGYMNITGRLGIFRIDKKKLCQPVIGNGDLIPTIRWVKAYWDTLELEDTFGRSGQGTYLWRYSTYGSSKSSSGNINPLDVFYMPIRLMDADPDGSDYEQPMLTGLLLLPSGRQNGQYRRVGQFELSECWVRSDEESIEPLTETTRILDNEFFVSRHKHGHYTICIV